jgi:hypothetical protein
MWRFLEDVEAPLAVIWSGGRRGRFGREKVLSTFGGYWARSTRRWGTELHGGGLREEELFGTEYTEKGPEVHEEGVKCGKVLVRCIFALKKWLSYLNVHDSHF